VEAGKGRKMVSGSSNLLSVEEASVDLQISGSSAQNAELYRFKVTQGTISYAQCKAPWLVIHLVLHFTQIVCLHDVLLNERVQTP
jgi:hypothetical protein